MASPAFGSCPLFFPPVTAALESEKQVQVPSLKSVAAALAKVRADAVDIRNAAALTADPDIWWIEVRLQVNEMSGWKLHRGPECLDQDHTGYWGYDHVGPDSDLENVARTLLEEVEEEVYIHGQTRAIPDGPYGPAPGDYGEV